MRPRQGSICTAIGTCVLPRRGGGLGRVLTRIVDRGNRVTRRQRQNLVASDREEGVCGDDECAKPSFREGCEGCIDFVFVTRSQGVDR